MFNSPPLLRAAYMPVAVCIGCGCDDNHACVDKDHHACSWLVVNRKTGKGVCSFCIEHLERWHLCGYAAPVPVGRVERSAKEGKR